MKCNIYVMTVFILNKYLPDFFQLDSNCPNFSTTIKKSSNLLQRKKCYECLPQAHIPYPYLIREIKCRNKNTFSLYLCGDDDAKKKFSFLVQMLWNLLMKTILRFMLLIYYDKVRIMIICCKICCFFVFSS